MAGNTKKPSFLKANRLRAGALKAPRTPHNQALDASISRQDIPEGVIRKLSDLLKSTDLAEIEITTEKMAIRVRARDGLTFSMPPMASPIPAPAMQNSNLQTSAPRVEANSELHLIRSPFVGTFYRAPSPSSPSFVEQGQSISKGQSVGIVEAMKLMNEIEADMSGVIEKIFVENGAPVEFNTPLFGIRK